MKNKIKQLSVSDRTVSKLKKKTKNRLKLMSD